MEKCKKCHKKLPMGSNYNMCVQCTNYFCDECFPPNSDFCSDECNDAFWEDYANHQYDEVEFDNVSKDQ